MPEYGRRDLYTRSQSHNVVLGCNISPSSPSRWYLSVTVLNAVNGLRLYIVRQKLHRCILRCVHIVLVTYLYSYDDVLVKTSF